jgi:hyperosmotically inducible periplasmic protein
MFQVHSARNILMAAAMMMLWAFSAWPAYPQKSAAKAAQADEKYSDNLSREIHHQLNALPYYSVFDNLVFSVQGGKVTLKGFVLRPTLKTHAEQAIKDLSSVTSVVNEIEILPVSTSDDELRRALYRAIYEDKSLERYAVPTQPVIHIIVKNGNVDLEGSVDSALDRAAAGARAQSTPNVSSLKNNLAVREKQSANK